MTMGEQNLKSTNDMSKRGMALEILGFLAPAVIPLFLLTIATLVFLYWVSLTNYELGKPLTSARFVGFENYIRLFSGKDPEFWKSVRLTLTMGVIATAAELMLGMFIALLLDSALRGKGLFLSILMLPMVVTPVIVGLVWKLMLNSEHGVINWLLAKIISAPPVWLGPKMSFTSVILVDIWQWTPFVALIILSGLSSLPVEPFEAAAIDGCNPLQVLWFITLPLLKPIIMLAVLFRLIDVLKVFDIIFVITGGGLSTETLSLHSYRLGFGGPGWIGRASAISIVLAFLVMGISTFLIRQLQHSYKERRT